MEKPPKEKHATGGDGTVHGANGASGTQHPSGTANEHAERQPAMGSETIFLAEDEESVREMLRYALEEFGYQVIAASDGQDAIEIGTARARDIDLAILDVVMPQKSGKEVYDAVRAVRPDIPVLFISGYAGDVLFKKGISGEGVQIMIKPLSPYELLRRVREMLDRKNGSPA